MSGGVDSSVSAALLREQGYDVVGVFMRLGSPGESIDELVESPANDETVCDPKRIKLGHQGCCSVSDAADARLVAAQLGIPFYVVNFRKDFGRIMDYFAAEYAAGRTPNPCVRCNDWLKFGKLHDYAHQIDADFVASGHYARVERIDGKPCLLRGLDHDKDQSYVLFGVPRDKMSRMLLPVGGLRKTEVRAIAQRLNLPVFNKPDSQEICFVPDNDYGSFVSRRLGDKAPGDGTILDESGRTVGTHQGHHRFTIGQRRGVGVALGYPIFVTGKDPAANTITVGPRERLLCGGCTADEVNWLNCNPADLAEWQPVMIKYRYNTDAVSGHARASESKLRLRFATPQEAVTPGQAVVLYDAATNERVLAGGWIDSVAPAAQGEQP